MFEPLYQPFPMHGTRRAQIWRYSPEFRRPRHFHVEPELNLVVAGRGVFGAGKATHQAGPGDLLCWLPGQDHELIEASVDFDLFVIGMTPELSERVLRPRSRQALSGPTCLRLSAPVLERLSSCCAIPWSERGLSDAETYAGDLWREAHDLRTSHPSGDALGRRALVALLEGPHLRRAALAELARGNASEVSRSFPGRTGVTLTAYRTRLRLLRFIQLVDAGSPTCLRAALEAGFGSYSQCHRAFQSALGCSPRQFFETPLRAEMRDRFSH